MAKFILTSDVRLINADLIAHARVSRDAGGESVSIWFVNDASGKEGMYLEGKPAQEVLLALTEHFEVISFDKANGPDEGD
jgi:hypothetical protein